MIRIRYLTHHYSRQHLCATRPNRFPSAVEAVLPHAGRRAHPLVAAQLVQLVQLVLLLVVVQLLVVYLLVLQGRVVAVEGLLLAI